jgi:hypothetical protein
MRTTSFSGVPGMPDSDWRYREREFFTILDP